jgi:hypothetical protein
MLGGHKRPKLFPQLVNRFTCRHPVLTKPAVEPREDCVSPIMTPPYAWSIFSGAIRLNDEWTGCLCPKARFPHHVACLGSGPSTWPSPCSPAESTPVQNRSDAQRICASVFALSARYISEFMVEAKIHALWIPATLARLEKFMRGEARQRKVTHHEDEDCPPHCADGSDEVRVVLAIVHAFESRCSREEDCLLTMERGPSVA